MKRITIRYFAIALAIHVTLLTHVHAGSTTITTADNSPVYNEGNGDEVITGPGVAVTFDTQCTVGNGVLDGTTYDLSQVPGATLMPGYPQLNSTHTDQKAIVLFDSTTAGHVNKLTVEVYHNSVPTSGVGMCISGGEEDFYFVVNVPQISVTLDNGIAGFTNFWYGFNFASNLQITGCDDLSKIDWYQQIGDSMTRNDYATGTAETDTNNPYANQTYWTDDVAGTPGHYTVMGWVNVDDCSLVDWQYNGSASGGDLSATLKDYHAEGDEDDRGLYTPAGSTTSYAYGHLLWARVDFQDQIRRDADKVVLSGATYYYGFNWYNYNQQWNSTQTPPPPSDVVSAVLLGEFGGDYNELPGDYYNATSTDGAFSTP